MFYFHVQIYRRCVVLRSVSMQWLWRVPEPVLSKSKAINVYPWKSLFCLFKGGYRGVLIASICYHNNCFKIRPQTSHANHFNSFMLGLLLIIATIWILGNSSISKQESPVEKFRSGKLTYTCIFSGIVRYPMSGRPDDEYTSIFVSLLNFTCKGDQYFRVQWFCFVSICLTVKIPFQSR